MMSAAYDFVIVGGGPAGMSAALYAVLYLEKMRNDAYDRGVRRI